MSSTGAADGGSGAGATAADGDGDASSEKRLASLTAEVASLRAERDELNDRVEQLEDAAAEGRSHAHAVELERYRVEASAKSQRARQLIAQKDKELEALQARVSELELEVQHGKPAERRILEFAHVQAQREQEVTRRDARIQSLETQLVGAQDALAASNAKCERLQSEVEAQHRALVAAGPRVNMEYLKNVVLRYMTFGSSSSEAKILVPVISTLLQFSDAERRKIERPKGWGEWFGSTKVLHAPAHLGPPPMTPVTGHPPPAPAPRFGAGGGAAAAAGPVVGAIAATPVVTPSQQAAALAARPPEAVAPPTSAASPSSAVGGGKTRVVEPPHGVSALSPLPEPREVARTAGTGSSVSGE